MAIRKWMVVASLALVAVVALTVASIGSAKPAAPAKFRVALVTDIGGLNDRGFNALAYKGLKRAQAQLGIDGRVFISKSAARLHPEPVDGRQAGLRPRDRGRVPHVRRDRRRGEEVPEHEVRDRRRQRVRS